MARKTLSKSVGGPIVRSKARERLKDGEMYDAVGVYQKERGRYRPIHEAQSIHTKGAPTTWSGVDQAQVLNVLKDAVIAWYDFSDTSDTTKVTVASGRITAALDQGPRGNDAAEVGGSGPADGTTYVSFDGVADYLTAASLTVIGDLDGCTLVMVIDDKMVNGASGTAVNVRTSGGDDFYFITSRSLIGVSSVEFAADDPVFSFTESGSFFGGGRIEGAVIGRFRVGRAGLYVDGQASPTSPTEDDEAYALPAGTLASLHLGVDAGVSDFAKVDLKEVMLLHGTVTDAQLEWVFKYLNDKYSLYTANSETIAPDALDARFPALTSAPEAVYYWRAAGRLVACDASGNVALQDNYSLIARGSGIASFTEYGEFLIIGKDGRVMYALHKDNVDVDVQQAAGTGVGADVVDEFLVAGRGIPVSHLWYETGSIYKDPTKQRITGSGTGWQSTNGVLQNANAVAEDFASVIVPGNAVGELSARGYRDAFIGYVENSTRFTMFSFNLDYEIGSSSDTVAYRIGVPGQWAMGRFPHLHDNRLCFVEGRAYELSAFCGGAFAGAAPTGKVTAFGDNYVDINIAVADFAALNVNIGDTLVLVPDADIDPIMTEGAQTQWIKIIGLEAQSSTSYRVFLDTAPQGVAGTLEYWYIAYRLSKSDRRRVWYTGRAKTSSVSRDDSDFLKVEAQNYIIVGDDVHGDITCAIPYQDDQTIYGQEAAIMAVSGPAPVGGVRSGALQDYRLKAGVGIRSDRAWCYDGTGSRIFFNSPTDDRMYVIAGGSVEPIDDDVLKHPDYSGKFSHVIYSDGRILCLNDEGDPIIWIYDLVAGYWESRTERKGCGQDQTGTLAAVEPGIGLVGTWAASTAYAVDDMVLDSNGRVQVCTTAGTSGGTEPSWATTNGSTTADNTVTWTCYTTANLYDATHGHGGIFAPYSAAAGDTDVVLVCYKDAAGHPCLRTMMAEADEHLSANLLHAGYVIPGYDSGRGAPVTVREGRTTVYGILDDGDGNEYDRLRFSYGDSEGESTRSVYEEPVWDDAQNETASYVWDGEGDRGNATVAVRVGDGVAPVPPIEFIEVDVFVRGGRK